MEAVKSGERVRGSVPEEERGMVESPMMRTSSGSGAGRTTEKERVNVMD
jgi:hypothetical protein